MLESEINGETEISLIMLEDRDKWRDKDISDYVRIRHKWRDRDISNSNIIRDNWIDNLDYVRRQRQVDYVRRQR